MTKEEKAKYKREVWYPRNREKCKARAKVWYRANRERAKENMLRWREQNPEVRKRHHAQCRDAQRLRLYGVTREQYDALLEKQGGRCALCGAPPPAHAELCLDHCHTTGKVRGILCQNCNKGLSWFENPEWVSRTQTYLKGQ